MSVGLKAISSDASGQKSIWIPIKRIPKLMGDVHLHLSLNSCTAHKVSEKIQCRSNLGCTE